MADKHSHSSHPQVANRIKRACGHLQNVVVQSYFPKIDS